MPSLVRHSRQPQAGSGAVVRSVIRGPEVPDAELVERARGGNHWAEEMLYRRHAQYIVGLCARLVRHRADTDDIVQDAFVTAFEELGRLREPALFRRWLTGIAVHQAHRRLRRRRLLRMLGLWDGAQEETLAMQVSGATSPDVAVEMARLDSVLARLSDRTRIAWQLRYVEGYRLEEVADLCDCSLATAKRRIVEAAACIKQHLNYEEVSDD